MNFRLSRITEHNKNEETDHLYDPLRDTLRKSSASKGKTLARVTSAHQLQGSKVSRVIRELSPEQADYMQRQIWIPADKKLKPTDHLTRVAGKQFYALEVQQKRGATLTEEQFKRVYHGNQIQETVYEFGSSNNDSRQPSPFPSVTNQGLKFNSIQRGNSYNSNQISDKNRQTYVGVRQKGTFNERNDEYNTAGSQYGRVDSQMESGSGIRFSRPGRMQSGQNPDSRLYFQRESGSERFNNQDYNRIDEPNLKGKVQQGSGSGSRAAYRGIGLGGTGLKRTESGSGSGLGLKGGLGGKGLQRAQSGSGFGLQGGLGGKGLERAQSGSGSQGGSRGGLRAGLGGAGLGGAALGGAALGAGSGSGIQNERNSKYGRAKSTYKYNLFSGLDEAVNTKCGSFGKNEIIAKKPQRPWG